MNGRGRIIPLVVVSAVSLVFSIFKKWQIKGTSSPSSSSLKA